MRQVSLAAWFDFDSLPAVRWADGGTQRLGTQCLEEISPAKFRFHTVQSCIPLSHFQSRAADIATADFNTSDICRFGRKFGQ